jgi:hypothetical protein
VTHNASEPDAARQGRQACEIGRSPILGQTCGVLQGGVTYRGLVVTGEALHRTLAAIARLSRPEETQVLEGCEVADESVVVMKFRPVKPGNSVEEKTGTTTGGGSVGLGRPKAVF